MMKIVIDECFPKRLKSKLQDWDVKTVPEMGWQGKENSELFSLIQKEFDVFITTDYPFVEQYSIDVINIGLIILKAESNRFEALKPLISDLKSVLKTIQGGEVVFVESC